MSPTTSITISVARPQDPTTFAKPNLNPPAGEGRIDFAILLKEPAIVVIRQAMIGISRSQYYSFKIRTAHAPAELTIVEEEASAIMLVVIGTFLFSKTN